MLLYYSLFVFFAIGALFGRSTPKGHLKTSSAVVGRPAILTPAAPLARPPAREAIAEGSEAARMPRASHPMLIIGGIIIALVVGLRYKVGADWMAYERMFARAATEDLGVLLNSGDPAYMLLNWLVEKIGADIWLVNLVCGAIFSWGLVRFARVQSDPWLATAVAVPYLVIVVAMGFSRQGVAIGILMAGLAEFERGRSIARFVTYGAVATLFHSSSLVMLPLVLVAAKRNRVLNGILVISVCLLFYNFFVESALERFVEVYIGQEYSAQGAWIRVLMNVVPAITFLLFRNRLSFNHEFGRILFVFSLAALVFLAALFVTPSSAALDRFALYLSPLQMAVLSRVPGTIVGRGVGKLAVILYSFAILFVWLNYARHADLWLPYRFFPVVGEQ